MIRSLPLFGTIILKELQQDLKRRGFLVLFIATHLVMLLVLLPIFAGEASLSSQEQRSYTGVLWFAATCLVGVIMPFRFFLALNEEADRRQLELIFLTNLTARHLAVGKWLAAGIQSLLIASAILPYLSLLYFLGGVELPAFLVGIVMLLLLSLAVTALGISLWGFPQARVVMAIAVLSIVPSSTGLLHVASLRLVFGLDLLWILLKLLVLMAPVLMLLLELGAGRIAPRGEDHTFAKRMLAAFLPILLAAMYWIDPLMAKAACAPLFTASLVVALGSIFEEPSEVTSTYRRFIRFDLPGKVAGRFLYLGWDSGFLFTILIAAASALVLHLLDGPPLIEIAFVAVPLLGAHALCSMIARFMVYSDYAVTPLKYALIHAGFLLVTVTASATKVATVQGFFALFVPHMIFGEMASMRLFAGAASRPGFPVSMIPGAVYCAAFLLLSLRSLKYATAMERKAARLGGAVKATQA